MPQTIPPFPIQKEAEGPGIAQWILNSTELEEELVLMPLAYLDGEENVRVCAAMDLILRCAMRQRPSTILSPKLAILYYCSVLVVERSTGTLY
jgi:hypothetical protein